MRHGSLFTGIGGFDLAAQWTGWENIFQVEIDEECNKTLRKNFPNVKRFTDIKNFDGTDFKEKVDIISGGYPCQPFSVAGSQKAQSDTRHLWPEMCRVITQARPTWVVCENVYGHIALGLDRVLHDLESINYSARPFVIPAIGKGADHNRKRVFIVAYSTSNGCNEVATRSSDEKTNGECQKRAVKNSYNERRGSLWATMEWGGKTPWSWGIEPPEIRVDDGLPRRMDRNRMLGNAIIPQEAFEIFKVIDKLNKSKF